MNITLLGEIYDFITKSETPPSFQQCVDLFINTSEYRGRILLRLSLRDTYWTEDIIVSKINTNYCQNI